MKELETEGFGYEGWCWYNPYKYVKSILQQYDKLEKKDKEREKENFINDLEKCFLEQIEYVKEKCVENGFQDRFLYLYVNMFRLLHSFVCEISIEDLDEIDWFRDKDIDEGLFPDYLYFIQTRFERLFFNKENENDEDYEFFLDDTEKWERDKFDDDGNIEETFLKERENILKENLDKLRLE